MIMTDLHLCLDFPPPSMAPFIVIRPKRGRGERGCRSNVSTGISAGKVADEAPVDSHKRYYDSWLCPSLLGSLLAAQRKLLFPYQALDP